MSGSEASFNDNDVAAQEIADSLRKMGKIVNNLSARADCIPFRKPVDWKGLQLYDYPKIITKMMDLGTIKNKLEKGKYADASECAEDIRLVWRNCMTYNADGSDFYRLAESYSKRFEERYQKLVDEFGEDVICVNGAGRKSSALGGRKSRSNSLASTGRNTPVPGSEKGGKINYESMGIVPLDARTKFAARLQRLSGMELGHVLQTIDIQCPEALEEPREDQLISDAVYVPEGHRYAWDEFDGGCQVEIDVDAIPAETFWKLDQFVKEKVQERGKGPWSDDVTESEPVGKKRKMKSI